ncbi:hypothetical protein C8R45DRAFT_941935 [Mycena sanguinolenta]|nr:hypothetical protein C8R45DRAFT_941935 [Mycena sanguinolenta]
MISTKLIFATIFALPLAAYGQVCLHCPTTDILNRGLTGTTPIIPYAAVCCLLMGTWTSTAAASVCRILTQIIVPASRQRDCGAEPILLKESFTKYVQKRDVERNWRADVTRPPALATNIMEAEAEKLPHDLNQDINFNGDSTALRPIGSCVLPWAKSLEEYPKRTVLQIFECLCMSLQEK